MVGEGSLHRYPDQTPFEDPRPGAMARHPGEAAASGRRDLGPGSQLAEGPPTLERWDLVESRWNLGSVMVLLAGAALAVVGVVTAARTGVDDTWYRPVEAVAGVRHTQLLGALEAAGGVLLVIAGLAGARGLAALVCITGAMAAGVAAIEPGLVADELALQRWWAIALAASGAGLAVVSMVPWPHFVERHYTRAAGTAPSAAPDAATKFPAAAPVKTPNPVGAP
jgi:hypothetical protein